MYHRMELFIAQKLNWQSHEQEDNPKRFMLSIDIHEAFAPHCDSYLFPSPGSRGWVDGGNGRDQLCDFGCSYPRCFLAMMPPCLMNPHCHPVIHTMTDRVTFPPSYPEHNWVASTSFTKDPNLTDEGKAFSIDAAVDFSMSPLVKQ